MMVLSSLLFFFCGIVDVDPHGVDYLYHSDMGGETWRVENELPSDNFTYLRIEWHNGTTLKIVDSLSLGNVKTYRAKLDESSQGSDTLQYEVMPWSSTVGRHYLNFDRLSPSKMYLITNYYEILNDRGYHGPKCLNLNLQ